MSSKRTVTPGGKGKKRAKNDTPANLNRDLNKLRGLAASTLVEMDAEKINVSDLALLNLGRAAKEMTDDEVKDEIETIMVQAAKGILTGNGLEYGVALRAASNQLYIPELDRLVLKDAVSSRPFSNVSSVKKVAISTRVLSLIHEVVSKNIHITKRDLFYTDVKLFTKQSESDAIIEDVATMIGCTRNSLNVVASEKGVVVGRMSFRDDGDLIDCTKMGVGGKVIPGLIDRVSDIKGDAEFVLLVEKDAVFMRLSEDRFYNDYPCIIITAKGQPDIATRLFLKRIRTILKIPILGLMDSDPHGLKILSVYMHGSKNMSYDSEHLTTADIKWLGVRPSDLERYNIPVECRLDMTESDLKTGRELLNEDFVKKNPKWVEELELMNKTKQKAEIQALSSFGFQYLSKTYLPQKLRAGDWI